MAKNFMLLYGKKSVSARLNYDPSSIKEIFLQDNFRASYIEKLIKMNGITTLRLSARKIENMKRARNVQGIIAKVDKFNYTSFDQLIRCPGSKQSDLIFLDGINDPQNLGVIIRSLACFGNFAIIIPEHGACSVTEAVLHVACGGENYVSVSRVADISESITGAKSCGYWIVGAVVNAQAQNINSTLLSFPLGVVFGSETQGISQAVQKHLNARVYIPMRGERLSFNVSMACTIFGYEINRQQNLKK